MAEGGKTALVELFGRALDVPRAERAAFLDSACGGDHALRHELDSLLEANDSASGYFDALAKEFVVPAYASLIGAGDSSTGSPLIPHLEAVLGDTYRFERELTGGAMSRVFLAEEIRLGRKVVIKVLPPEMTASVSAERFRREIQVAAQLQHPHIVPLLASDSSDVLRYYTMPFVAGESLRARLEREGTLSVRDAEAIWRDVLDALAHAHANGVIHRDIKPANILLSGRSALVTDFGIARAIEAAGGNALLTGAGLVIGTPAYMAPEQLVGSAAADHRQDIYAAGMVMYEMLEGRSPFDGNSPPEMMLTRLAGTPRPLTNPACSPGLADLILQCLAVDPAARPRDADAVLSALDGLAARGELERSGSFNHSQGAGAGVTHPVLHLATRRRALYGFAALIIAAVFFGALTWWFASGRARRVQRAAPSIAVLPFANLSADPADAALADGLTEELIATLGRRPGLRVIGSTSVFAFKNQHVDVRQIAESLHVDHILEGGFQKVGNAVRMQVRLLDARDGSTMWSETYDRRMGDILTMQDEISGAVGRELDVRLAGASPNVGVPRRHTPDIAAYEWYLRGMDRALMRSDSGLLQGIDYFNHAIAVDSNFAGAYAGLVRMYLGNSMRESPRQWHALANQAASKAVSLDDSLAEAHVALGWARMASEDYRSAEVELKRAVALDPNVTRGYEGLARVYAMSGRPAEQLAAARLAVEQDPFFDSAIRELALALSMNGQCDEAIQRVTPLKRLIPPNTVAGVIIGLCRGQKKDWPAAITEFRWAMDNGGWAALPLLGYALARAGHEDGARVILADLLAGRKQSNGPYGIAVVYAGLGDHDKAFAWLDKAAQQGTVRVYIMNPMFAELHSDPRFERFKQQLGQKR